jgi:hypothetical protein
MFHADPPLPVMSADAGYPVRKFGFVMQRNGHALCVRSKREKARYRLNQTAGNASAVVNTNCSRRLNYV